MPVNWVVREASQSLVITRFLTRVEHGHSFAHKRKVPRQKRNTGDSLTTGQTDSRMPVNWVALGASQSLVSSPVLLTKAFRSLTRVENFHCFTHEKKVPEHNELVGVLSPVSH